MVKRVVIFGGTGRTGKEIAKIAIEKGYDTVCFGRSANLENVPNGAIPFRGDMTDEGSVRSAIKDCDIVILALSISRTSSSPFARITGDYNLHSRSMKILTSVMNDSDSKRIVKISAQGVGESKSRTGLLFRILIRMSNLKIAFNDHAKADQILEKTNHNWTIIRPPRLNNKEDKTALVAGESLVTNTRSNVSRTSIALWIIESLENMDWKQRCVTILPRKT